MQLSKNALRVLESRYLLKSASGELVESPEQLFRRVAKHIASAELIFGNANDAKKWEEQFYGILTELKFLPNSPTLMNAGTSTGQLSACFVLPVSDSINGIFTTLKNAALVHQSGGGTGFNFSQLRPNNDFISPDSGNSSGPVSFMKIFDAATGSIKQGGKRRGANMGVLDVDHPDIEEFINCKRESSEFENFNISVGINNKFMQAVLNDSVWELKHPSTREVVRKVNAKKLWSGIVENAWISGDPGLIFIDTINQFNPTPAMGDINCTNPCGEVPLLANEACNLGSIDVSKFIKSNSLEIDWLELEKVINTSVRFLDNVVEVNEYIIPEIKSMVTGNRKIGLGIMGWANLLIALEIPYASDEAIRVGKQLMNFIAKKSEEYSTLLAKERGVFKNWDKSVYAPAKPLRNATRTSIAPTGTISIIADTSSSIEPLFALTIRRENVLNNETFTEVNSFFLNYLKKNNLYTDEIMNSVLEFGTLEKTNLPEKVKNLFKTSLEIEPSWHLRHQIAFQEFTDNAVSKTINLPNTASPDVISDIYFEAWKQKAKGITVYRYNSKEKQVLYSGNQSDQNSCKVCRE